MLQTQASLKSQIALSEGARDREPSSFGKIAAQRRFCVLLSLPCAAQGRWAARRCLVASQSYHARARSVSRLIKPLVMNSRLGRDIRSLKTCPVLSTVISAFRFYYCICSDFQELGQEAVSGVDLLCRTSGDFLRELAETDTGGGGVKVLASFVTGVYRATGSRFVGDVPRTEHAAVPKARILVHQEAV